MKESPLNKDLVVMINATPDSKETITTTTKTHPGTQTGHSSTLHKDLPVVINTNLGSKETIIIKIIKTPVVPVVINTNPGSKETIMIKIIRTPT